MLSIEELLILVKLIDEHDYNDGLHIVTEENAFKIRSKISCLIKAYSDYAKFENGE